MQKSGGSRGVAREATDTSGGGEKRCCLELMKQVRARKSVFTMFQKKTVTDTQMVANAKGKELPLRVILHAKQRGKIACIHNFFLFHIYVGVYVCHLSFAQAVSTHSRRTLLSRTSLSMSLSMSVIHQTCLGRHTIQDASSLLERQTKYLYG